MYLWFINILFMCLIPVYDQFYPAYKPVQGQHVNRTIDTGEGMFYHKARFTGWFKNPVPHVFIEVRQGEDPNGWVGYEYYENKRPFKECWKLIFNKIGENKYEAIWGEYTYHTTRAEFRKMFLVKEAGKWYFSASDMKGRYELQPYVETPHDAKVLRDVYAESVYTTLRFYLNDSYGFRNDNRPGKRNLMDSLYSELPFDQYRKLVDELPVNALATHLSNYNNLASPYPYTDTLFYSASVNGKVVTSKLYGSTTSVFFKMLQQAVLIKPVSNFTPELVVTRKNYHALHLSENKKLKNNEVIYQFKNDIMLADGYYFKLNKNVTNEIIQLFNFQKP